MEYDRDAAKRTSVIDDQSDYFEIDTNSWLTDEVGWQTLVELSNHGNHHVHCLPHPCCVAAGAAVPFLNDKRALDCTAVRTPTMSIHLLLAVCALSSLTTPSCGSLRCNETQQLSKAVKCDAATVPSSPRHDQGKFDGTMHARNSQVG